MSRKHESLHSLLEEVVTGLGYQLWGIEWLGQGSEKTLRIYIDAKAGITVDDCARVSHQVSGVLDVEESIRDAYTLEVSSPGIERPLFSVEQFSQYIGYQAVIKLQSAYEKRRRFVGQIIRVESDEVVILCEEHTYTFPIETIQRARLSS